MSIQKQNNYAVGNVNLVSLMETVDQTFRGKNDVTLSNFNNDLAAAVKVGSVFENNGTLYLVITSDIIPSDYGTISVSTAFYLYFNVSTLSFKYSETIPVWNDDLQGYYNGNDRALFGMYKDSGGSLYQAKTFLKHKSLDQIENLILSGQMKFKYYYKSDASPTEDDLHTILSAWLTVDGQYMSFTNSQAINGQVTSIGAQVTGAWRQSANDISLGLIQSNGVTATIIINNGSAAVVATSIEIMGNFDPIN